MDKAEQMQAAEKHALVQTTNTPGWRLAVRTGEAIVREFVDSALTHCDEQEAVIRFRKAQVAKEFWGAFLNRIDQQKFVDAGPDPQFDPQEDF